MSDLDSLDVTPIPPSFNAGGFDCGETDLTDYLCDGTAAEDEKSGFSRTYLVQSDNELVGYFTVLADSIRLKTKERPGGMQYSTAPAIKLGRMGVHKTFRGHKVGTWILDYVVGMARATSRKIGVRYITLDALPAEQLVAWYGDYGFVQNEGEQERSIAVLKFFKRWKAGDALRHVSMRFDILLKEEASTTG